MTEEDKIFAGHMFDPRSPELREIKHKAHEICRRYNQLDEFDPARRDLILDMLGGVGSTFYFQGPIQFNYGSHTFIGENFFANFGLTVMDDARVYIGDNVVIGAGSVVTKDIPDGYLAFGNPCRPVRPITEADSKKGLILPEDREHFSYNLM